MLTHTQERALNIKRKSLVSCQMYNRLANDRTTLHVFVGIFFSSSAQLSLVSGYCAKS